MNNYIQMLGDLSGAEDLEYLFIGIFGFMVVLMILTIITVIVKTISLWPIFEKSKEEGWKALIPFYNTYTLCKIVGVNPYWILIVIIGSLLSSVPIVGLVASAASIYFTVLQNVSLAKSYGKDTGFAIGLIVVPYIFYPILGFGKSEYIGANPMEDIIFKKTNPVNNNVNPTTVSNPSVQPQNVQPTNSPTSTQVTEILDDGLETNNQAPQVAYCTNCGNQLNQNDSFCTNCGTKRN